MELYNIQYFEDIIDDQGKLMDWEINTRGVATGLRKQIKKLRDLEAPEERYLQQGHTVILQKRGET